MTQEPDGHEIHVPLSLLNIEPTMVTGDRAFVLDAPAVGRVEVGDPLPNDIIWQHFDGDLIHTVVIELDSDISEGGGDTWDCTELSVLCSQPASGDDPTTDGWVLIGFIPQHFDIVRVRQGSLVFVQTPIRGHAMIPLDHRHGPQFEIYGQSADVAEELLFTSTGIPSLGSS